MLSLIRRLWYRISQPEDPQEQQLPTAMQPLIMGLANTQIEELSCDEVYELIDVYAERLQSGEDAASLMPLVRHHIEMCPDCREELNALLRSMEAISS